VGSIGTSAGPYYSTYIIVYEAGADISMGESVVMGEDGKVYPARDRSLEAAVTRMLDDNAEARYRMQKRQTADAAIGVALESSERETACHVRLYGDVSFVCSATT